MLLYLLATTLLQAAPQAGTSPAGVFRARGYSWLIERGLDDFALFHHAGVACWPDPDAAEMEPIFARRVPGETEGLVGLTEAGDDEQATIYHFEPIPALPNSCTTPDRSDRAAVIAIADLMTEHYPGFAEREIDFAARRAEVLSR